METTMRRRADDDRGAVLIFLSISLVALLALAGLVIDGGRAYGERRQMQNAADAAAMAATRQLDQLLLGKVVDASTIDTAARHTAEVNGAKRTAVTCTLVSFDRTGLGPCPTGTTMSPAARAVVAGVSVTTEQTQPTIFMQAVGTSTFTARADATAEIGRPGGRFIAPFIVCGTAPGHIPQLLLADATSNTGFKVNSAAIGSEYTIYGNDIKTGGRDCGNPSSSFRGNVCIDKNKCSSPAYTIPGEWDADTGNANGPTLRLVNSGNACSPAFTTGCVLVLPLCPRGNGQGGAGFRTYCTDLGLFEINQVSNHDITAFFRGATTINHGGIVGPADLNGSRIVALTD
jgi:Flp pilus assembly protein TadG